MKLHNRGLINILLVPIEGESWNDPDTGLRLSFPTPDIVMANFGAWFPNLDDFLRDGIRRLYAGGEYTSSRLIEHTRMHYKCFERLLVARVGLTIKSQLELNSLIASGGATEAQKAATAMVIVAEANALTQQLGHASKYEVKMMKKGRASSMGYSMDFNEEVRALFYR